MGIEDKIRQLRDTKKRAGEDVVPYQFNGVSKDKIRNILSKIDRSNDNIVDAVFALIDPQKSWYSNAPEDAAFKDGASTAHIGTHIGILQRDGIMKLDREGRDYWLKPLWELGAIEKVYLEPKLERFLYGHLKAKSPNCAYRLAAEFIHILESDESQSELKLEDWISKDRIRERLKLQAEMAKKDLALVDNAHSDLIKSSCEVYAKHFLKGYEVVYIDDSDGDRITETQRDLMKNAGIEITISDAMPDALLWNKTDNSLWVIEAVTSDGEVDIHKQISLKEFAKRFGKTGVGFTTTYQTWKKCAERQHLLKNLADDTHVWIEEDPSRSMIIKAI